MERSNSTCHHQLVHPQVIAQRWGWVITIATYFIMFVGIGGLYSFGIISLSIQADFNVGVTATGWIPAVATGLSLIGGVGAEWLIEKTSHRIVGVGGTILCTCSCIVTSFMPGLLPMYLTFGVLYGVGIAMSSFAGVILIRDWFPINRLSRASLIIIAGTSSGMLALNPLTYVLVSGVGWRNTLRIMGAMVFCVGLAGCATFSLPSKQHRNTNVITCKCTNIDKRTHNVNHDNSNDDCTRKTSALQDDYPVKSEKRINYELLSFPEFWLLSIGIILSEMSCTFFIYYWVEFLVTLGFQESTAALAMTVMGASDVAGKILWGWIADYLPFPKLYLFQFACFAGIGLMLSLLVITSLAAAFVLSSVCGVFVLSLLNGLPYLVSPQVFPGRGATPVTTSTFSFGVGIILGTVYGTSKDNTDSFNGSIYGCIAANCVSILLFAAVPLYQRFWASERYLLWTNVSAACKRNASPNQHAFSETEAMQYTAESTVW